MDLKWMSIVLTGLFGYEALFVKEVCFLKYVYSMSSVQHTTRGQIWFGDILHYHGILFLFFFVIWDIAIRKNINIKFSLKLVFLVWLKLIPKGPLQGTKQNVLIAISTNMPVLEVLVLKSKQKWIWIFV